MLGLTVLSLATSALTVALSKADGETAAPTPQTTPDVLLQEIQALQAILNNETDSAVVRKAVDHAAKATDDFAQKRMNATIQKALAGKNVAEI